MLLAATVKVAGFYGENFMNQKQVLLFSKNLPFFVTLSFRSDKDKLLRIGSLSSFGSAFLLGSLWTQSVSFGLATDDGDPVASAALPEDHQMSPGVVFAAVLYCFGRYIL